MLLIVGLGNPGAAYSAHRHNIGFKVLDAVAAAAKAPEFREKFSGLFAQGELGDTRVGLLKPMTFMNLSGSSVQPAATFLKVSPSEIIVVHDELDVPFGSVRVKVGGGHAGHNGLRSIIDRLGSADFTRVRVGIGRPPAGFTGDVADFVLQRFSADEQIGVPALIDEAASAVRHIVADGALSAMNRYNTRG